MGKSKVSFNKLDYLVEVIQSLSLAKTLEEIIDITRHAARKLTGADGATFILRDGERCFYVDEDAIGPLWKGNKFPLKNCISGWAMIHSQTVKILDIYQDERIPHGAYRPTFVKSLMMVPIRKNQPIGAIGNYWATNHEVTPAEQRLLEVLADSTSIALENVQLLNSLKDINSSLESSLKSRDEFLSIASHELKTPISAIKLQLQINERQIKKENPNSKSPLDISLRQIDHLTELVEKLLDVSRIQLNKVNLQYSTGNCSEILSRLVEFYRPQLEKQGHEISIQIEDNICGEWDCMRLEQIITNLFSNVMRHAPGSKLSINLSKDKDDFLTLEVTDTGPGISPSAQSRIFTRFERGDSSLNVGGMGLGLFIIKNIIESHGGQIFLDSDLGRGTKFTVKLPCNNPFKTHDSPGRQTPSSSPEH